MWPQLMKSLLMVALVLVSAVGARAQQSAPPAQPRATAPPAPRAAAPAPSAPAAAQQKTASVTATLYRVDEGMFDMRRGQTIDLTDRKILFSFPNVGGNAINANIDPDRKEISLTFNGQNQWMQPGQRFSLKDRGEFKNLLKDKSECYLDLIDVALPKGAVPIATFRFECN